MLKRLQWLRGCVTAVLVTLSVLMMPMTVELLCHCATDADCCEVTCHGCGDHHHADDAVGSTDEVCSHLFLVTPATDAPPQSLEIATEHWVDLPPALRIPLRVCGDHSVREVAASPPRCNPYLATAVRLYPLA